MKWTQAQYEEYMTARGLTVPSVQKDLKVISVCDTVSPVKPQSKFGNRTTMVGNEKFDSQKEANRYLDLKRQESGGLITKLTRQVTFELAPRVVLNGKTKRALTYRADFSYLVDGVLVVEDVKGMITKEFRTKQHLMMHLHGIDIKIT